MDEIEKLFVNAERAVRRQQPTIALFFVLSLLRLFAKANEELYNFYIEKKKKDPD